MEVSIVGSRKQCYYYRHCGRNSSSLILINSRSATACSTVAAGIPCSSSHSECFGAAADSKVSCFNLFTKSLSVLSLMKFYKSCLMSQRISSCTLVNLKTGSSSYIVPGFIRYHRFNSDAFLRHPYSYGYLDMRKFNLHFGLSCVGHHFGFFKFSFNYYQKTSW